MVFFTQRARPALCAPEQTVKSELTPIDFGWATELNEIEGLEFLTGVRKIQGHVPPKLPSFQVQRMFVGSDGISAF